MTTVHISPTFGYYRQSNGWITVSPATQLEEIAYQKQGWQPLTRYGRVEMTSEYMAEHPFEVLFMKGGAKEMPVEQVIELGFAINPPLLPGCNSRIDQFHKHHTSVCWEDARPTVFPQLIDVSVDSFLCTICNRTFATAKAKEQHERVIHQPEKSDMRTGQTLADALVKGLRGEAFQANENLSTPSIETSSDLTEALEELAVLRKELAAVKAQPKQRRRRKVA